MAQDGGHLEGVGRVLDTDRSEEAHIPITGRVLPRSLSLHGLHEAYYNCILIREVQLLC